MSFPYWDQKQPIHFSEIIVKVLSTTIRTGFIERQLEVADDVSMIETHAFLFVSLFFFPEGCIYDGISVPFH